MTDRSLMHRVRNTPVRLLIRALEKDGFTYRRRRGAGRLYRHADGRRVVIHYHKGSETLPMKTLQSILTGAQWTEADVKRLGLV